MPSEDDDEDDDEDGESMRRKRSLVQSSLSASHLARKCARIFFRIADLDDDTAADEERISENDPYAPPAASGTCVD